MSEDKGYTTIDYDDAPPIEPRDNVVALPITFTEHHHALAFVDKYCDVLRYVHDWKKWIVYTGVYWRLDESWEVERLIRAFNVAQAVHLKNNRAFVTANSTKFAGSVEKFASIDKRVGISSKELDKDPLLLGTPAGVYDLRTGKLKSGSKNDYVTKITAFAPAEEGVDCPKFKEFLKAFACGDEELIKYHRVWAGYNLTGVIDEQKVDFKFGEGHTECWPSRWQANAAPRP
jgi:putative DNA primase/helicase